MPYRYWTPEENEFLRQHYGVDLYGWQIAETLGRTKKAVEKHARKLGLSAQKKGDASRLIRHRGADHWAYRPPGKPWDSCGRLWIKRTDNAPKEMYARYVWEQAHGPIAPGRVIAHRDGDYRNCELANLQCLTKADILRRNLDREKARKSLIRTLERCRVRRKYGLKPITRYNLKKY